MVVKYFGGFKACKLNKVLNGYLSIFVK
jgi:hypothetical protein